MCDYWSFYLRRSLHLISLQCRSNNLDIKKIFQDTQMQIRHLNNIVELIIYSRGDAYHITQILFSGETSRFWTSLHSISSLPRKNFLDIKHISCGFFCPTRYSNASVSFIDIFVLLARLCWPYCIRNSTGDTCEITGVFFFSGETSEKQNTQS